MKRFFNILLKLLIVFAVIILAMTVLVISINSEKVPDMVAYTDSRSVQLIKGNYRWNAFSEVRTETNMNKDSYVFKTENILLVSPEEKITLANTISSATRHTFSVSSMYYIDSSGTMTNVDVSSGSSYQEMNYVEFNSPLKDDTYHYYCKINYFEKGEVEYGLKVIVSSEVTYDLDAVLKYKNTSLVDSESIDAIIKILPHAKGKTSTSILANDFTKKIVISYSEIILDRSAFLNNVTVMFALIPEVDTIEYKSPEKTYIYTRREVELIYERDITEYSNNKDLWEAEVFFGERQLDENRQLHTLFSKMILDSLDYSSGDAGKNITVNTKSFRDNTNYNISNLTRELIISDLNEVYSNVFDMDYEEYATLNQKHPYVEAITLNPTESPSGDIQEGEESSGDNPLTLRNNEVLVLVRQNDKESMYLYKCFYVNDKWMYYKENVNN